MTMRRAVIGWFLFALVCAQSSGLLHRIAHLPQSPAAALAVPLAAAEPPGNAAKAAGWLHALFPHDAESGCRLFDGVSQCGTPPHASDSTAQLPPAAPPLLLAQAGIHQRQLAPFLARGPPGSP